MPASMKQSGAAVQYARAVLELANERKQAETIGQELAQLKEILDANPTFLSFLRDPGVSEEERARALEKILKQLSPLLANTLKLLSSKRRLVLLPQIADVYHDLLDEQLGKIEVDVTVAQKLDPGTLEQVRQRVSQVLKKDAVVHQYVDDSIIGGMVLRVEDKLIDASVRSQLEAMKKRLFAAAPQ
jgi:F-type H+-transporting ATPase subunit delta